MSKQGNSTFNLALVIGILGFICGIGLLFTETWFIGVFGAIASAGIAYKGYQDSKAVGEDVQ
ncbi:MAG: hypothetical protein HRU41_29330 [Saprospiraceae bacterium]|nr:hypothetical protein [Saprospiraceae bacterium]